VAPAAVPVEPSPPSPPSPPPSSVAFGGFLQPQYRGRQDVNNGFRIARARLSGVAQTRAGNLELSTSFEAEMRPQFTLQDAYATVARTFRVGDGALPGRLALDGGQMRVPVSRQNMLSDSRLSFAEKAQLATIAPDRDVGLRLTAAPPVLPIKVFAGVFNGEGKNQVENLNAKYLYTARVEVSPWGRDNALAESAFAGNQLTLGLSYGHNNLSSIPSGRELVTYLGADVFGAYKGLSASFEYLQAKHAYEATGPGAALPASYKARGWVAQAAYLLPVRLAPLEQARLELGARVEQIDRNDAVQIMAAGDPEQKLRIFTGVVSYYLRMHSLKVQLAASHVQELEDRTATGASATYDNDQLLVQVTYRLE
jgi:hypothetical protein